MDTGAGDQDVSDESGYASDALHNRTAADRNARVQLARRQQDSGNDRIRTAGWWLRRGQGKFTVCSVQLQSAHRAVERCAEHEVARYSGPDESVTIMGDLTKLIEQNVIKKTVEVHLKHNTLSG